MNMKINLKNITLMISLILLGSSNLSDTNQNDFYKTQSEVTNPGQYEYLFKDLPDSIEKNVEIIQGLMVHGGWVNRYKNELIVDTGNYGFMIRRVSDILQKIHSIDSSSLSIKRPLEKKLIVNCRTFATMLCSILRYKGVPARVRSGYATYFNANYENHWICEYWDIKGKRWIKVDAQIDSLQKKIKNIEFNSLEVPDGAFIFAGEAWQLCRSGKIVPDKVGVTANGKFRKIGYKMLLQNIFSDFRAINKTELLPWDTNPVWDKEYKKLTENEISYIDSIAKITLNIDSNFNEIQSIYRNDARVQMPDDWKL